MLWQLLTVINPLRGWDALYVIHFTLRSSEIRLQNLFRKQKQVMLVSPGFIFLEDNKIKLHKTYVCEEGPGGLRGM